MTSRHISTVIAAVPEVVYRFAADPENLPAWASGLAVREVRRVGNGLVVESPMGRVTVEFVPRNDFGVLDHDVTLPSGEVVTNPLRVVAHPDGSEVIFTLRQLDASEGELASDAAMVAADLARLKALVEAGPGRTSQAS